MKSNRCKGEVRTYILLLKSILEMHAEGYRNMQVFDETIYAVYISIYTYDEFSKHSIIFS